MAKVRLLRAKGLPIIQQLRIEEALLRITRDNWCLLNDGCAQPAIVMGISGCVPENTSERRPLDYLEG